jgi:hypothetical protein
MTRQHGTSVTVGAPPLDPADKFTASGFVVQRPAAAADHPSYLARSDLGWCFTWRRAEAEVFATPELAAAQLEGPAYGEGASVVEVEP